MKKNNDNLSGKAWKPLTGFTLIEIVIAIAVMALGVVGIYSLVAVVIKTTSINTDQFIASELAREGMELVRNFRDQNWIRWDNWQEGLDWCSDGCEMDYNDDTLQAFSDSYLLIDNNGFYNYSDGQASRFKRKIIIIPQVETMNVTAQITWRSFNDADESYEVQEKLYNWR